MRSLDTNQPTATDLLKSDLRRTMSRRRDTIGRARRDEGARAIASHLTGEAERCGAGRRAASYRPMNSEIDPTHAEDGLRRAGFAVLLPVTPPAGSPLVFRHWQPGEPLERHRFGMLEPPAHHAAARPEILLVPLLAFDRRGYRLGYGGGYYDRTLHHLRATGACLAIGLAFSEQEVDAVPREAYDQRLDSVITPDGVRHFDNSDA